MFNLAQPWLLLLLPLPWLVRRLMPKPRTHATASALKIPFYRYITQLQSPEKRIQRLGYQKQALAYAIWGLLILAASGPQWLGNPILLPRTGRDIMLAVDLSGSMQIPDMALQGKHVDRLTVVKAAAKHFINNRTGDRLGLILFGSRADLQTPLTFDRKTVAHMLDDATVGLAGIQTAIGDAIGLAIKQLSKMPQKSRVLILLTDGGNNSGRVSPIAAANVAAKEHIKIYTIGLGANQMIIQGLFGPHTIHPTRSLDEKTLKKIANITGGVFFRAANTADLNHVYTTLNKLEPVASNKGSFRPITPLYPWPLGLALLLSFMVALYKIIQVIKLYGLTECLPTKGANH